MLVCLITFDNDDNGDGVDDDAMCCAGLTDTIDQSYDIIF